MNTCQRKAYAKINLGLDVLGLLPNGYHKVKMIMQTVDIWDKLIFEKTERGIVLTTDSEEIPVSGDNLIHKAARLMQEEFGVGGGVKIHLHKNIPIAAGMAGGSTDAAATMRGINELYELGISDEKLMQAGVRIGADVPYCILGGTALAEGIGEKLTALPQAPECTLVVVKPDFNISTREIYQKLDAMPDYPHPDIDGMITAISDKDLRGIAERLGNVLEPVTVQGCPVISRIRAVMNESGALGSLMSGSGPTVFGIFRNVSEAEQVLRRLQAMPELMIKQGFVTKLI